MGSWRAPSPTKCVDKVIFTFVTYIVISKTAAFLPKMRLPDKGVDH